ncbi:DUF4400 domain-containing protein [Cysteiniphilum litorale]|uniref:DUF4400 domain-containing protein n=1 Tax=Cysteiniphilum litorale TaxID=2056700 RepID=UPI003F880DB3
MTSAINTHQSRSDEVTQNKLLRLVLIPFQLTIWLLGFAVTGCVILICFYLVYWLLTSYQHAYNTLIEIYNYNIAHFYVNPDSLIGGWINQLYHSLTQSMTGVNQYFAKSMKWVQENSYLNKDTLSDIPVNDQVNSLMKHSYSFVQKGWSLIQIAFYVTVIKFLTSLSFYQLYIMAIILAFITGNHKRLYRRYCVDRESEAKHNVIRGLTVWLPSLGVILYLIMPFKINPMMVAMTSSFICYVLLHYLIGSFKKYL